MAFLFHGCFQSFHQHCFFPVDVQSSTAQFFLELWDGSLGQVFHLRLLRVWMAFLPCWHVVVTSTRVCCLLRSSSSSELPSPPMPRTKIQHERTREETYEFLLTMAPGASIPPDERKNSPRRILLHETGLDGKACACVGERTEITREEREKSGIGSFRRSCASTGSIGSCSIHLRRFHCHPREKEPRTSARGVHVGGAMSPHANHTSIPSPNKTSHQSQPRTSHP